TRAVPFVPYSLPLRLHDPSEALHYLARDVASGPIGVYVPAPGPDRRERDRAGRLLRIAEPGTHHLGRLRLEDRVAPVESVTRCPHPVDLELHPQDIGSIAVLGGFDGLTAMLIALFADLDCAHRVAKFLNAATARGVGIKR